MYRTVALAGVVALALSYDGVSAGGQSHPVDLEASDCTSINQMLSDSEVARASRRVSVPSAVGTLELRPDFNGGVRIERGPGGAYGITACIAAADRTMAEAQAAADSVRLEVDGGRVRVRGDDGARDGLPSGFPAASIASSTRSTTRS